MGGYRVDVMVGWWVLVGWLLCVELDQSRMHVMDGELQRQLYVLYTAHIVQWLRQ